MKKILYSAILFIAVSFCVPSISFGTQCNVGFSYTVLSQDSTSCTVQFSDTSVYPDSYHYNLWNFGDGTTSSTVTNPIHTYQLGNTYWVCLTIYDSTWAICDSNCLMIDLAPGPDCYAAFWYNSNHMIFSFQDNSLNPATWSWDFGDGNTSAVQNPSHTYSLEGHYNVCLEISDASGTCTDTYCNTLWATCFYDTTFHYSASGTTVHFTGPDSSDVSIIYTWDFGDGNSITANNPLHTYASGGDYFVCLYIDDTSGVCSDTICKNVHVNCVDPSFSYQHVCPPKYTYSFTDNTVGNISSRLWDFGDGQTDTIQNPTHTYLTCGYYNICLTVTTDSNCTMQKCSNLYVQCCEVNFTYYYSGAAVVFDNDSAACDYFYYGYHWDFGDGTSMNQNYYDPYVQHIYLAPGTYTVCLSNIDTSGYSCCTDTLCQNVVVITGDTCSDLSADIGGSIRPQIQTQIVIQYCNYGNVQANNSSLSLDLDPLINPVSANPSWSSQNGNTLTWDLNSIPAGQCSSIYLNVIGDASLQAGTVLCSDVQILSSTEDCDTVNNSLQECMNVVNSFDPNDKLIAAKNFSQKGYVENDTILPSDKLDYIIHFQNTGSAPAINIFIYDTLDSHVNPSTVLPGACSYPYTYFEIIGNVLKWSFIGINLADSVNNEPESHGFIKFSVSQNSGNALGINISNNAGIVFDFNEPVITNNAVVVLDSTASIVELTESFSFSYFPNPVVDDLFLLLPDDISSVKCELTDMTGKLVYSIDAENAALNQGTVKLSLKHLATGTYSLTATDKNSGKKTSVLLIKQ